jgi:hypothetical protein
MTTTAMDTTPLLRFLVEQRGFHSGAVVACPSFAPVWQSRHISPSQMRVMNPRRRRGGGWKAGRCAARWPTVKSLRGQGAGRLAHVIPGRTGTDDVPFLFDKAFQFSPCSAAEALSKL